MLDSIVMDLTPQQVKTAFSKLMDSGVKLKPAGRAKRSPRRFLNDGYWPRYKIELFGNSIYLTDLRQDPDLGFFVAFVHLASQPKFIYPRIFYKDVSLIWRSATHVIRSNGDNWVGKGALRTYMSHGEEMECSAEETTDLPFELQPALDVLSRKRKRPINDPRAVQLVLRNAPDGRLAPYADFSGPRELANANPRNRIHGGRNVAYFKRKNDPTSLQFVKGYKPDFGTGVIEVMHAGSRFYGGLISRYRILSENRKIQYLFMRGPKCAWIIPPQALTTEISSYGPRTIDVRVDEDLCVPGFEYHYWDDSVDPPELCSQIPAGYVGKLHEADDTRADASAWIEALPIIQEFRRCVQ